MRAALLPVLVLAAQVAAAEEIIERIPVLVTQLDGTVKLQTVRLAALPDPWQNYVCIREFDGPQIRCYALNGSKGEVFTFDLTVEP